MLNNIIDFEQIRVCGELYNSWVEKSNCLKRVKHLLLETPVHDVFTPSVSVCFINVLDIAICQKFMVVTTTRC